MDPSTVAPPPLPEGFSEAIAGTPFGLSTKKPTTGSEPPPLPADFKEVSQGTGSDIGDTLKQYWDQVNPVKQAQGAVAPILHPKDTYAAYSQQQGDLLDKAKEAFKNKQYSEGVRHGLMYMLNGIPGVGSQLDKAGTKAGTGDVKGAVADTAALATMLLEGKALPKATEALSEPGAVSRPAGAALAAVKAGGKDVAVGGSKALVGGAMVPAAAYAASKIPGATTAVDLLGAGLGGKVGSGLMKGGTQQAMEGFLAGKAAAKKAMETTPTRSRVAPWQTSEPPAEGLGPTQGPISQPQLPSGRVPGSIANQAPAPTPPPPVDRSSLLAQWLQQAKERIPDEQSVLEDFLKKQIKRRAN